MPTPPRPEVVDPGPPPLLRHGQNTHVFPEPLPGRGLRLLFGGPPYRLCEVEDLAEGAAPRARCSDPALPAGAESLQIVSVDEGVATRLRAGRLAPEGPLLDAGGAPRFELPAQEVHVAATGPIAGLEVTNERGWQLLRLREKAPPDRLRLPAGRDAAPVLLGDVGLHRQGGHLHARRVLAGERPFGPAEDLGPAPPWSARSACRSRSGTTVALLTGELSRSVPNAGSVDEPGPAVFVFAGAAGLRAVTTTLPARPERLTCNGGAASVIWVRTDRRAREARRRHEATAVRCTADGCATRTATLTGLSAWDPPAVDLGGEVLLVWADGPDVRMRLAPLDGLGAAPDRVILSGAVPPASIELYPRGAHAAVLVDYTDHAVLLRVSRTGAVVPVAPETELPPLASGVPRFGGGN